MDKYDTHSKLAKIKFSYDDNQRYEEIIALKTIVFSILRNLPHDMAINIIKTIENNKNSPEIKNLCLEMVDAILSTTQITDGD